MQALIDFFQKNPYMILLGVFLGIVGGVITIATGWSQFYEIMRSRLTIPAWVVLLIIVCFLAVLLRSGNSKKESTSEELVRYEGKSFGIQTIVLDGKDFVRCDFNGTKLIFEGGDFGLKYCRLNGITIGFGGRAEQTLFFLTTLYQQFPEMRPIIDQTLENTKTGIHPITPPTTDVR